MSCRRNSTQNQSFHVRRLKQTSGGARKSRQPGHFQVTKVVKQVIRCKRQRCEGAISRSENPHQVTRMHIFFLKKSLRLFFKTKAAKCQRRWLFHCQNKTNKVVRYGYQSKAIGRAEPGRWIFQPGHFTWCRAATETDSCWVTGCLTTGAVLGRKNTSSDNLPPNMAANDFLRWNATLQSCSNSRARNSSEEFW